MSYKNLVLITTQVSISTVIFFASNLIYSNPTFATVKQESKESKTKIDYEKSNRYHNIGIANGLRGNLEEAIENYSKAISFNPEYATAYLNRSSAYLGQFKWDLALADINKAIELDPKISGKAYYNRAGIYNLRNQWDKALADYKIATELRSNYHEAHFNRGIVFLKQGNWKSAIEDLEAVAKIDSENAQAYSNLGFAYMKLRQWNNALEKYGQSIAINADDGKVYYNRAMIYARTGNRLKAIADLQKAKELFLATGDMANYRNTEKFLQQYQQPLL